jgi:toxin FitB
MYLIDTNILSEARKKDKANKGVIAFLEHVAASKDAVYLSAVSVGELRRSVDLIRHRGDSEQAQQLEAWLIMVLEQFGGNILAFDSDAAQVWGRLSGPNPQHALDQQIAAIALINGLTVVTRNTSDFAGTGVGLINPFLPIAVNS